MQIWGYTRGKKSRAGRNIYESARCNLTWRISKIPPDPLSPKCVWPIQCRPSRAMVCCRVRWMYSPVLRIHDILVRIRIRGSMPLTNGSGSCYFRLWPSRNQDANKTLIFYNFFFTAYFFMKVHFWRYTSGFLQNSRNQGFAYYFCLMIEGSGSVPLTNGSGSGSRRPKNKRIRRIRIRNTDVHDLNFGLWWQGRGWRGRCLMCDEGSVVDP